MMRLACRHTHEPLARILIIEAGLQSRLKT